ncbi:MAG: alpha/beta hydrolase fold domain-containing protein, partial [Gemmata sp.]
MPRLLMLALALSVSGAVTARAPGADAPKAGAPGVKLQRDVLYDTVAGEKLYLDVARPEEGGPYPCVVLFHGGAWITGSRKELSVGPKGRDGKTGPSLIEQVAAKGYVVASVGYRLAPKHVFPAQIQDARSAVRFLRANAKDYGADRDKFAAGGFSAGAHLSLLLGLADRVEGWDTASNLKESSKVQCVVDFFGPTDLTLYNT